MLTKYKILAYVTIGAVIASAIVGGIRWYGSNQYDEGKNQCQLEAQASASKVSEEYRKKEEADRKKAEEEYEKHEAEKIKTDLANRSLTNLNDRLRSDINVLKRRAAEGSANPKDLAQALEIGFRNFESCRGEYESMAKEYAGTADQLNGLIAACQIGRQ